MTSRNFGLDLIRAVAILLVVLSHCTYIFIEETQSTIINGIRVLGAIGVDLFFVLSGYLIGGILLRLIEQNRTRFKDLMTFWKRRWLRTLPNYYLVLILNIVVLFLLGKDWFNGIWYYFLFLQNFYLPHPEFFTEAWSLSIEEYAYLTLPFVLYLSFFVIKKVKPKKLFLIVTILVIIVLTVLKIDYAVTQEVTTYKQWSSTFRKVTIYRIDAIYWGFLMIYLVRQHKQLFLKNKTRLFILGAVAFVATHAVILVNGVLPPDNLGFYTLMYLQLVAISLLLMFPLVTTLKSNGKFKALIYFISTRSYAIYLVNYSIILLSIMHFFDVTNMSFVNQILGLFSYLAITVLLSEILFRYYERPILKYRDRFFRK